MGVGDTGVGGTVVVNPATGVSATTVGIDGAGVSDTAVGGGFTATSVGVGMAAVVAVDGGAGMESQADRNGARRNTLNGSRLHERVLRDISAVNLRISVNTPDYCGSFSANL
jgi:hypothetical protein